MNALSFLHCFFSLLLSSLPFFAHFFFFFLFILNPVQLSLQLLCVCSSHAWRIRIQLGIRTRELHAYLVKKILGQLRRFDKGLSNRSTAALRFFSSWQNQSKHPSYSNANEKKTGFCLVFHQFLVKSNFLSDLIEFFKDDFLK